MCWKVDLIESFIDPSLIAPDLFCNLHLASVVRNAGPTDLLQPVYSPASLLVLLASLFAAQAPRGETQTEMNEALSKMLVGHDSPVQDSELVRTLASRYVQEVMYSIANPSNPTNCMEQSTMNPMTGLKEIYSVICVANLLLINDQVTVNRSFLKSMEDFFKFKTVKYSPLNKYPALQDANTFVNFVTGGKISQVVNETDLDNSLLLINVIYLQSSWLNSFTEIKDAWEFEERNGDKHFIRMLNLAMEIPYMYDYNRGFKAVQIPLKVFPFAALKNHFSG
ncbi:hypothetical protein Ciccas_006201 [Cichlidogyrus casuarinus]|uniref:Serpin domain-containing protein n=1 Tax=Cichlidogyrus casuarinus TaxID=1844966 RepID=A0ABD2Q6H2_9PLAT